MEEPPVPAEAGTPIPRGIGARRRVLRAALQVLDEHGLAGFTMEAVARSAGASKATLYRHWPTSGALLIDAMDATFQPFPVPDTGHVATDVAELLAAFADLLERTPFPRLLAAFIDAAERDPALRTLHADLTRRRREPLLVALARGRDRGQLSVRLDLDLTVDLLAAPFFYRRFVAHRPITPDLINDVIAEVLRPPGSGGGAAAPVGGTAPRHQSVS
ncbi:TetR/AcrR family transcriptional regulator [Paractinoplanes atraurantiacus]|uniref:DNA-binding transcriptional regulator, AcrR family n=1 Tax=Paractinoplanes atraurantiacus TaxID=1036182 RepID=A0A285F4Z6_9ACTN|nr:TetR/AcrR family transcriptional regulator [Actinoplanes atraurantiacus]SNY05456.1 DNA-binding transcriptional regulator, AcrR family [Actinoplanes atraurantiacus]